MRDGVLEGMRALLAENGRLVANGARRTEGKVNELQPRGLHAPATCARRTRPRRRCGSSAPARRCRTRRTSASSIRDAVLDIYGIPVAYFPYFWHADPSVRRASGFLVPSFGSSRDLGAFLEVPVYWAIDDHSDATITPTFNTKAVLNWTPSTAAASTTARSRSRPGSATTEASCRRRIFAKGQFAYDDTWRYGFDINRASSATYLRDYRFSNRGDVLTSRLYVEGFGTGAYTRLDALAYQGLVDSIVAEPAAVRAAALPIQLLRRARCAWAGGLSSTPRTSTSSRGIGTNTQRLGGTLNWERPFTGAFGELYGLTLRTDAAAYTATSLDQEPNYCSRSAARRPRGRSRTVGAGGALAAGARRRRGARR